MIEIPLFGGGSGTPSDPYLINTAQHLKNIDTNFSLSYYKQTSNINLKGEPWSGIYVNGGYDGGGHSISNIRGDALFSSIGGTFKNINIVKGRFITCAFAKEIKVGSASYDITLIENCKVIDSEIRPSPRFPYTSTGFAEKAIAKFNLEKPRIIRDCHVVNCKMISLRNTGVFVYDSNFQFENCSVTGMVYVCPIDTEIIFTNASKFKVSLTNCIVNVVKKGNCNGEADKEMPENGEAEEEAVKEISAYVKNNNIWCPAVKVYPKEQGQWKLAEKMFAKVQNEWKQ